MTQLLWSFCQCLVPEGVEGGSRQEGWNTCSRNVLWGGLPPFILPPTPPPPCQETCIIVTHVSPGILGARYTKYHIRDGKRRLGEVRGHTQGSSACALDHYFSGLSEHNQLPPASSPWGLGIRNWELTHVLSLSLSYLPSSLNPVGE